MRTFLLLAAGAMLARSADKQVLMAVFAHPDDETMVGALLAKYVSEGHKVYLLSLSSGDEGEDARKAELKCPAQKLAVTEVAMLDLPEGSLHEPKAMDEAATELVDRINKWKPDVLLTFGPDGVTGNADHRTVSNLTTQVFQQRGLLTHQPRKLYYIALSEKQFEAVEMNGRRVPFRTVSEDLITTIVDCKKFATPAFAAIQCHKSQWDRPRMEWNQHMFEEIMEGKITLRLAFPPPRKRETDIFE